MMKISQQRLAALCSILQALTPECRMMITDQGWTTRAVDAANVGMVMVNLPKASFEEYTETDRFELGMDVEKWKNMLDVMKDPKDTITIEHPKGMSKLTITDGKYIYTHNPLDPETVRKWPNAPTLQLPAAVVISAAELQEVIRAMLVIADKARLTVSKDGLAIDAEGATDRLHKVLEVQDTAASVLPEVPLSSLFSLDYLKELARGMKSAGNITVHAGQDHPLRFDFDADGIEAGYLLAPRLEAD